MLVQLRASYRELVHIIHPPVVRQQRITVHISSPSGSHISWRSRLIIKLSRTQGIRIAFKFLLTGRKRELDKPTVRYLSCVFYKR